MYHTEVKDDECLLNDYKNSFLKPVDRKNNQLLSLILHATLLSLAAVTFIFGSARLNQASSMLSLHGSVYGEYLSNGNYLYLLK